MADAEAFGDRGHRHPDVDAEASHIGIPNVFFKETGSHPAGKSKFTTDRLAHGFAVKRASHRVNDPVRNGAIVFVAVIVGSNVVVFVFQDGTGEQFDPARCDAAQV